MTPEDFARQNIDRQLDQSGWIIQDLADMNIMAGLGVAVREFPLTTGEADYGLYIDGRIAGVIESKKEGHTLTGVETQTDKYAKGLPEGVPHYALPLPFAYESTGVVIRFTNRLNPTPRSREVFSFHRPEELKRLLDLGEEKQLRTRLQNMPELQTFRDRLFTEIFPDRQHVPKTLIFAKNDNHAEDIVKIVREEFGKGNDFCQKITSKTTGKKPVSGKALAAGLVMENLYVALRTHG